MISEYERQVIKTLPKPPKNMRLASDDEVAAWLKACADVSSAGIRVAFMPHWWPGSLEQRLRAWGCYSDLERDAQQRERARDQDAQAALRERARQAEEKERRKLGWAKS
jgi:hypothetical protein